MASRSARESGFLKTPAGTCGQSSSWRKRRRAERDELGARLRRSLDAIAARVHGVGEVRGIGPMLALELVQDLRSKRPDGERAKRVTARARELGLILLACGLEGNVIRILVPLVVEEEDLEGGLEILEEALVDADASGG